MRASVRIKDNVAGNNREGNKEKSANPFSTSFVVASLAPKSVSRAPPRIPEDERQKASFASGASNFSSSTSQLPSSGRSKSHGIQGLATSGESYSHQGVFRRQLNGAISSKMLSRYIRDSRTITSALHGFSDMFQSIQYIASEKSL